MSNEHANPDESKIHADAMSDTAAEPSDVAEMSDVAEAAGVNEGASEGASGEPSSTDVVVGEHIGEHIDERVSEQYADEASDVASGENTIDVAHAKRALEAVLLAASEPMPLIELRKIFDGEFSVDTLRILLEEIRGEWSERSIELVIVASGYRFRVKPEYQGFLNKLSNDKPPRYSRAVLETLAIISYRQPVTRGDIEDIRGVAVSPHILKTLEDRGWIDEVGHKDAPGRPALFATTKHFLDDLNLRSLEELPPLHELQATLDMSQAGAALSAGANLALPGVAVDADEIEPESANPNEYDGEHENEHGENEIKSDHPPSTAEANASPPDLDPMSDANTVDNQTKEPPRG
jgi:segregation and condensation protein B